jgi:hypothetical protein
MADLESYPPERQRHASQGPAPGTWRHFAGACALSLGSGIVSTLLGTGLEMVAASLKPGSVRTLSMGLTIILLFMGPFIAWLVKRIASGPGWTLKFRQGFLLGSIGFYAALLILYFSIVWGVH